MEIQFTRNELPQVAQKLIDMTSSKTMVFYGSMGAGKTTLIKEIVRQLGGIDAGTSPTFGIVNEYAYPDGSLLGYHFDFYRLKNREEAWDLGLEDYLSENCWIFIEWPEKIGDLLPSDSQSFTLTLVDENTRSISTKS